MLRELLDIIKEVERNGKSLQVSDVLRQSSRFSCFITLPLDWGRGLYPQFSSLCPFFLSLQGNLQPCLDSWSVGGAKPLRRRLSLWVWWHKPTILYFHNQMWPQLFSVIPSSVPSLPFLAVAIPHFYHVTKGDRRRLDKKDMVMWSLEKEFEVRYLEVRGREP